MGLFGSKSKCVICEKEVGFIKFNLADGTCLCDACYAKCGFNASTNIGTYTSQDVLNARRNRLSNDGMIQKFNTTRKVHGYLEIDANSKKWLIPKGFTGNDITKSTVYNYNDILDFELLEDGESIAKGGLGRAVAGGILFGGIGAVVGGATGSRKNKPVCTTLKIKISLNNISNPVEYISFITTPTKKDGLIYKSSEKAAHECLSLLEYICNNKTQSTPSTPTNTNVSSADEILKYKKLCDAGVITEEEFNAKKKQLLGL